MNFKRFLKWSVIVLAALFFLLSVLPYLIPLPQLTGNRRELAYADSIFTEVGGIELHYRQWGRISGEERNVLLVHGLGCSTFSWRYTAPFLQASGYNIVAVDLPGFGLSERKQGFNHSSETRAELLWFLLEDLDPQARWDLIGHSMGGATVTAMALQKPEMVNSITLAAGALAYFEPSLVTSLLAYPPAGRWARIIGFRVLVNEKRVTQLLASAYGRNPAPDEVEGYYRPFTVENTDAVLVDLLNTAPAPLLDRVETLTVPVFLIWGEDDRWVPLDQGKDLARLIDGAELVVLPGEGHAPMETAADLFNEELLRFLEGTQPH